MEFSIINLLLVLLAAWLAGMFANRLGYPSVLGELLAGIVLGPPLLGLLEGGPALSVLAEVGILLMMLYIGMEIDPAELGRASRAGLLAAVGGFVTPFVLCYLLVVGLGGTVMAGIFVGIAAGVTSLATKSRILVDLQLLDTRVAHVLMAGALIADTASLILFAAVLGVAELGSVDAVEVGLVAAKALLFFGAAVLLGLKVFPVLGRRIQQFEGFGRTASFTMVILVALFFAEMAELAGLHGILGSFLAGLFLREGVLGRSLSKDLMDLVRDASIGFLAPVFFVTAGFAVSLDVFSTDLGLLTGVIVLATIGKIAGTALFYLPTGYGWREGLTIGAGMNGRGAVEIIVAQIGLAAGLITQEIFSILVFMAIFTTATVPVLLKAGVDWLRRRGELVRSDRERRGTLIVGAGPTARALGRMLAPSQPVWVVDRNREQCALAEADGLQVVCGSALDEQVLGEADAARVRHFIALTPNAEVNALAARLARTVFYVPDVALQATRDDDEHAALLAHLHASTVFGRAVDVLDWDYRLDHGLAEWTTLTLERARTPASLFQELQAYQPSLPLLVHRGEERLPLHSGLALQAGDRVVLYQLAEAAGFHFDRFDRLVAQCPVLDISREVTADAFFELVAAALAPSFDQDADALASRFRTREAMSSTVLLPGLAIPHVMIEGTGRFEVLIARCREGIKFPGQDERVYAAFVLMGTEDERNFHLRALSAVAHIVQNDAFERDWLLARDAEALRKLILGATRRRLTEGADD